MALKGCCCCGLRGGAKAVGVFFLIITLLMLVGVIVAWALLYQVPVESHGFGVNTAEGTFGVNVGESNSILGGRSDNVRINLGEFGQFGASVSDKGRLSLESPGGHLSTDDNHLVPGLDGVAKTVQILLITGTVYVLLSIGFNSLLIHGTEYDSSCAVLAWLVFYGIHFVLHSLSSVIGFFAGLVLIGTEGSRGGIVPGIVGASLGVGISALLWFWWVLVYTFYRELRDGTRGFKYHRELNLQEPPAPLVAASIDQRKAEECA